MITPILSYNCKRLSDKDRDVKETHRLGNKIGSSKGHSRGYRRDSWDFLRLVRRVSFPKKGGRT